jgi:hypothetical protein
MAGTIHRRTIFLVAALSFIARQSADAAEVIFTIDKNLSSMTLLGNDNVAGPLTAQPQDSNSNVGSVNGHFFLDFDDPFVPTVLNFVPGHGFMNYDTKPLLLPNPGPGNLGVSSTDNTVQYKLANVSWDWASVPSGTETPAPIPLVDNSIAATDTVFVTLSAVEHIAHPSGSRTADFAGFVDSFTAGTWTLEEDSPGSGHWTLTGSGLEWASGYDIGAGPLGTTAISGTIVAHAVYGAQNIDLVEDFETTGSVLGGAGTPGGVDIEFTDVTTTGNLAAQQIDTDGLSVAALAALSSAGNFQLAGDTPQIWDVTFGGDFTGPLTVTLGYDENQLGGIAETDLFVWHFDKDLDAWEKIYGIVDTENNTITIAANSLSPLAVGVPEPSTWTLLVVAIIGLFTARRWSVRR